MATQPTRAELLAFQVGFGDCFLLRFFYPGGDRRHVLIDFGSFPRQDWVDMRATALEIRSQCGGKLDAVVATHRHADHINGFSTEGADPDDSSGGIIRACKPTIVVQPWTEDPDARRGATKPTAALLGALPAGVDHALALKRGRGFVGALDDMRSVAAAVLEEGRGIRGAVGLELRFQGENGLSNRSAVENLMTMGERPARYVFHGADAGLARILPGVSVRVLGPPTIEQTDSILTQRQKDPDEFWQLQALSVALAARRRNQSSADATTEAPVPAYARWLISRIDRMRARELLQIVRTMDKALNNTSVILLFEIGGHKLLFPGDAQIENWQYALAQPGVLTDLADVELYKVGHHGSLNATPRTLWNSFSRKDESPRRPGRLRTVVSTLEDIHGHADRRTEVPRRTLIRELRRLTRFHTTQSVARTPGAFATVKIPLG
jgi:hypothetical protein